MSNQWKNKFIISLLIKMEGKYQEHYSMIANEQQVNLIEQKNHKLSYSQEYFEEYNSQYSLEMKQFSCQSTVKLKEKLSQNNVRHKKHFNQCFEKTILNKIGNSYIFTVSVGYFEAQVYLLQVNLNTLFLQRYPCSSGAYASIFLQQFQNDKYIIKSQQIPEQSLANFDRKFDQILQEYFINKIASILQFGPKIQKIYEFDIVCFNNRLEFSMQFCHKIPLSQKQRNAIKFDLISGMKIMHSLQIVHRDIKPKNISWSCYFQKWVFLDFGFSSSIVQRPGQKTQTSFRGTYQCTSKQMKNLYHLKNTGFVDLYDNDLYGLKIAIKFPLEHAIRILNPKKLSLFEFFIYLCRMKYYIIRQDYESVQKYFQQKHQLTNQFLGLLLIERERKCLMQKDQQRNIARIYDKLKKKSSSEIIDCWDNQTEKQQSLKYNEQKKKDRKSYFKMFINEEENPKSCFLFLNQSNLRNMILKGWQSFSFIKKLFIFFEETLYGNSADALKRMKQVTDIIFELLVPKCENKSWIWRFNHLLCNFEKQFLKNKQFKHLQQVMFCYYFMNDRVGWARINKILYENGVEKNELFSHSYLLNYKEKQKSNYSHQQEGELVKYERSSYFHPNKYFLLNQILQKLNQVKDNSSNILLPYFNAYPICQQLPNLISLSYYLKKGNFQKLDQMAKSLFQFNKGYLEEIIEQLDSFIVRFKNANQILQQRKLFLEIFLQSYQQKLFQSNQHNIKRYWKFYFKCLRSSDFFQNYDQLKSKTISSFIYIIDYFDFRKLSSSNQIYIILFSSMKKIHESNYVSVQEYLKNLQKHSLIRQLKQNQDILIDFFQTFSFYEKMNGKFMLRETKFYQQICKSKGENWIFLKTYLFFWNTILNLIAEKQQKEAISIICSYTNYLTRIKQKTEVQNFIFHHFITHNTDSQLKNILMFLLQKESLNSVRQNNYLSAFILMTYLILEQKKYFKLSNHLISRIYVLSIVSLKKYPAHQRIYLQNCIKYKFRHAEQKLKKRKKRILDRQDDYARGRILELKKYIESKDSKHKFFKNLSSPIFENKIKKLKQNVKKIVSLLPSLNIQHKII